MIKIVKREINNQEVNSVDARELYSFLNLKKEYYDTWIVIYLYSNPFFTNGVDYERIQLLKIENTGYYRHTETAILTLDTAKHLLVASRSQKARAIFSYFVQYEKNKGNK